MKLSGWGRYPRIDTNLIAPRTLELLETQVMKGNVIARGNGRAYGDSAVSSTNTIQMKHFNRMLAFDPEIGQVTAEAGVLLADIIDAFLPIGWFPSVTPGSKFVSLGGMIAADVHGKNHHREGSFGNYVDWIDVLSADGSITRCSKTENTEVFEWTIGGMGLTGVIIRAAVRLRSVNSAWIEQNTLVAENINHAFEIFEQSHEALYSVAWIDCLQKGKALGRSLVMLGDHADASSVPLKYRDNHLQIPPKKKFSVPLDFPSFMLNKLTARTFNALYFSNGKRKQGRKLVDLDTFFYPLDAILGWNRIYGRRGFIQFQCVIPLAEAETGISALLKTISSSSTGAFLAVLKRFGAQNSRFSFPMEGYTLALDFPASKKTLALMNELDRVTLEHNGRFYLAKDSRMSRDVFLQSDPRAKEYGRYRQSERLRSVYSSVQSERLGL